MTTQRIQFGEWTPDQHSASGSLRDAKNVYPVSLGYAPFPNAEDYSNAASEPLNSVLVGKYGDNVQILGGGATKLFRYNPTNRNLDDVSKVGGYSSTSPWRFTQFGNAIIGANDQEKLQAWYIGSSAAFADVSASAPIAKFVTVVRDFVVAANLNTGSDPTKVIWSDIADETYWTPGTTSQSDFQLLGDGGNITGLSGGEFGLVFLEKAIVRMSYVGSPLFFQFDTISRGLGCIDGGSIAQFGGETFFLSDDGFYKCNGTSVVGIGTEKVDRYFFDDVALTDIDSMSTSVDPVKKLVIWNYPNVQGQRSTLVYNWQLNKWSRVVTDADVLGNIATAGVVLETLDVLYGTLEAMPASLDDRVFVGGKFLFAGARGNKIITFTGSNYNSEIITSDLEFGYNSVITLLRPQIDTVGSGGVNGLSTVKIASRKNLFDPLVFSSPYTTSNIGRTSLRSGGRYHRIAIEPLGTLWSNVIALDIEYIKTGNR